MKTFFARALGGLSVLGAVAGMGFAPLRAQTAPVLAAGNALSRPVVGRVAGPDDVRDRVLQGRAQLDENDPAAMVTLRAASQTSLAALATVLGWDPLSAADSSMPTDVVTVGRAQSAAEAHLYWGLAADKFAQRDEAITALARAVRFAQANPAKDSASVTLRRDSALELGRVLRQGLPLIAPDDALDAIAQFAHGGLWRPRHLRFNAEGIAIDVQSGTPSDQDFLITDGKVFPPASESPTSTNSMSRIPPIYSGVAVDKLPLSLQLDKMVAGYVRELDGPNRGQWRQVVRVFYASTFLTKDRRNDLPRAEATCIQFLKVHALVRSMLGLSNLYARGDRIGGVTTLWLLEVSALWPNDEDDPTVLAQLGARMPDPNVGVSTKPVDAQVTPLDRPWNVGLAGQSDSAPGDILFWKSGMARSEAEWLREVAHEYGHVALPPISGLHPPLEPFANGAMGETLVMLWVAAAPGQFLNPGDVAGTPTDSLASGQFMAGLSEHLNRHALPSLNFFRTAGPNAPARSSGNADNVRFIEGLSVYVERVFGAHALGRAVQPLAARAASILDPMTRRQLMETPALIDAVSKSLNDPWGGQKICKIWLPGAIPEEAGPDALVHRSPLKVKAGSQYTIWLYVPVGAESLRVDGFGIAGLHSVGMPFTSNSKESRIYFAGKSGWQQFQLSAVADLQIEGAQFERK